MKRTCQFDPAYSLGIALSSISIAVPAGKVERREARRVCAKSSVERVDGSAGSVYSAAR